MSINTNYLTASAWINHVEARALSPYSRVAVRLMGFIMTLIDIHTLLEAVWIPATQKMLLHVSTWGLTMRSILPPTQTMVDEPDGMCLRGSMVDSWVMHSSTVSWHGLVKYPRHKHIDSLEPDVNSNRWCLRKACIYTGLHSWFVYLLPCRLEASDLRLGQQDSKNKARSVGLQIHRHLGIYGHNLLIRFAFCSTWTQSWQCSYDQRTTNRL